MAQKHIYKNNDDVSFSKNAIVKWSMWYASITTLLWGIIYIVKGHVDSNLIGLTGLVITGAILSYQARHAAVGIAQARTKKPDIINNTIINPEAKDAEK